ncbi:M23 family metallopeptidase [Akkermansia sp.]|uniref:M23 family metallopeptidase n=1 Tax=Akkermansia sp. TaxID=1872421 RepID=UPI0025BE6023|nr:M23 family metallopeptidase [Akkermansia sp.]
MSMHGKFFPFLIGILLLSWSMPFLMADTVVRFPTENTALLDNRPQDFYMYVDRNFEGVKSQPWQAGAYGFTRTLVRTQAGPVAVKFHEGIDIKPLKRDASGTPLDDVHPVAGGTVVHASSNPTHSNYGRYVVIEHRPADGPFYSLYAHLASVSCKEGDQVGTGNVIGRLGYSGVGLNKTRAHVHLELCLKLQDDFETWYSSLKLGTPNRHGAYNGLNLAGFDPAPVLIQCKDGAEFSLSRHISSLPVQYVVRVPSTGSPPNLVTRYPFMLKPGPSNPQSWEISFTGTGVPVSVTPSGQPCTEPTVIRAVPHPFSQLYRTCNRVSGSSKEPKLTASGKRYIRLIFMGPEP